MKLRVNYIQHFFTLVKDVCPKNSTLKMVVRYIHPNNLMVNSTLLPPSHKFRSFLNDTFGFL